MASMVLPWVAAAAFDNVAISASAQAADFKSVKPLQRVEYWQEREATINATVADTKSLPSVRLFVGDSITDFWLLGENPWVKGQRSGRTIWDESFGKSGSVNFGLNIRISGDRTEHVLFRLLPKEKGGSDNSTP